MVGEANSRPKVDFGTGITGREMGRGSSEEEPLLSREAIKVQPGLETALCSKWELRMELVSTGRCSNQLLRSYEALSIQAVLACEFSTLRRRTRVAA